MFQDSTAAPHLLDCPRTESFLFRRRFGCHRPKIAPGPTGRMSDHWQFAGVAAGIAFFVPHFRAGHEFIGRLIATEQHGDRRTKHGWTIAMSDGVHREVCVGRAHVDAIVEVLS